LVWATTTLKRVNFFFNLCGVYIAVFDSDGIMLVLYNIMLLCSLFCHFSIQFQYFPLIPIKLFYVCLVFVFQTYTKNYLLWVWGRLVQHPVLQHCSSYS
jgi:hypothetical protein